MNTKAATPTRDHGHAPESSSVVPQVGMMATVRNRSGVIAAVEPHDGPDGRLHFVRVEYVDPDGPREEQLLWEREIGPSLWEPTRLPDVVGRPPMRGDEYDALIRAVRWGALRPFMGPEGTGAGGPVIASPFFGAVQIEDFQLVPLLQALEMSRISLLLADDVGLGKTVEAGLILQELLLRRRIRRVLILCPASLRTQWRDEMSDKFALNFDIVDRESTHDLQKRLGLDVNPWRTFPRIIASYYYLRQPDRLEEFRAACRQPEGTYSLPWDLLIVDEAHNLMPSSFGASSELTKMLEVISPWFEHKLFLTATPHNGHTRSFTGLLELLDPVRFTQTSDLKPEEQARVEQTVIRRLKSEINTLDESRGQPRRFPYRYLRTVPLYFTPPERRLSQSVGEFRKAVKELVKARGKSEQLAGTFAVEVLNKRLLSCPVSFADSWIRFMDGLKEAEAATAGEVSAAKRAAEEDLDDDQELEGRARHAAQTVGAWLQPLAADLTDEIAAINGALDQLGLAASGAGDAEAPGSPDGPKESEVRSRWEPGHPRADSRLEQLVVTIRERLRTADAWNDDERLVIFTEYKTTLDYVTRRLRETFKDDGTTIQVLFGGMSDPERDAVKAAFNDPESAVRVLVATDTASEGLNLQRTARYLLHFDVPWNPSRLEQRNGRLDRHGQARDVTVFHFTSEDDADLRFLHHVVEKVNQIREDLGSMGEVFDAAFQRRFAELEDADWVESALDSELERHRGRGEFARTALGGLPKHVFEQVRELQDEVDLSPETLRETLDVALAMGGGARPRLEGPDAVGRFRLKHPIPAQWEAVIDDTLRIDSAGVAGALPAVVFDPGHFVSSAGGRPVFRPSKDTTLLHLGHPMFRHALASFARARFPGTSAYIPSRWTYRAASDGELPPGADAVIHLTIEELGVNALREPFHHWVRTVRIPVSRGKLGAPLPHVPPTGLRASDGLPDRAALEASRDAWFDLQATLEAWLADYRNSLTRRVADALSSARDDALAEEAARYEGRVKEVEEAMRHNTIKRIEKERAKLLAEMQQGMLMEEWDRAREIRLADLDLELRRRQTHFADLVTVLRRDQDRMLKELLPRRFELRGEMQVFPVGVEIRS